MKIVRKIKRASKTNVSIHAPTLAARMHYAMLSTMFLFAHVQLVIPETRSLTAIHTNVNTIRLFLTIDVKIDF